MTEEEVLKAIENGEMTWLDISCAPLSEEFIEKYFDKLNKYSISQYQNLSETFIEKHFGKLDKNYISKHQKLSEEFIEKHFDKLDKDRISAYQNLSEEFIEKHFDELDKDIIAKYQYLSPEFRGKHDLPLSQYSWMYWTREDKEKYIKQYTDYKIKNGKVIAYKTTRKNGYSCFSFHYKYEVGKEYSSHCDCNANENNSFGLSAWSKEGALTYYDKGKLFLVEIDLDDLGCITDEGKIRCCKLIILEEIKE